MVSVSITSTFIILLLFMTCWCTKKKTTKLKSTTSTKRKSPGGVGDSTSTSLEGDSDTSDTAETQTTEGGPFDNDPFENENYLFNRGYFHVYNRNSDMIHVRELMHTISRKYRRTEWCDLHDNAYYNFNISANGKSELFDFDYQTGENEGKDKWSIMVTYREQDYETDTILCDVTKRDDPHINLTINIRAMLFTISRSHSGECQVEFKIHERDEFDELLIKGY